MTVDESFNFALQLHQSGQLAKAEALYRQILGSEPNHAETIHALGLLSRQLGRRQEAIQLIGRAITLAPTTARFHMNLGGVLEEMGQIDQAVAAYRKAVALNPKYPAALSNLGHALNARGEFQEAISVCRQAIAFAPNLVEAHQNLGGALFRAQQFTEAVAALAQAAALRPDSAQIQNEFGAALLELGQFDAAIAAFGRALTLQPDSAEAHNNLGATYLQQRQYEQAVASIRRAVEARPGFVDALNNLGNALRELDKLDESIAVLNQAIAIKPDSVEALTSLGAVFYAKGEFSQSIARYQKALSIRPDHVTANWNLGLSLLIQGDFERGWPRYEWRWKLREFRGRPYPVKPLWDGGELAGRRILLHAEQGFGDAIQFIRYLPLVAQRGGKVVVACHAELLRLFKDMGHPVAQWTTLTQPPPKHDVHCPLMTLPMVMKTTLATIPARVPYLKPAPSLETKWKKRLADLPGLKVGLAWAGRPTHPDERRRSVALTALAPLATAKGVTFVSLQKGEAAKQTADSPFPLVDWTKELDDFAQTAALIAHLDLVISVDTAVAHVAGGLAKPVWVLLPFVPGFLWLLGRDQSAWYPTSRLFRQPRLGDWATPIEQVAKALIERAAQ